METLEGQAGVAQASYALTAKGRPGRKVPEGWQPTFLEYLRKHGTRWLAAKQAGVSHDTVTRYEHADPGFASGVHAARQEFVDSLEAHMARLLTRQNNVVAGIVLLKKHRPAEYVEKNLSVTANFTTQLPPDQGRQLLHAMMFGAPLVEPTQRLLAQPMSPRPQTGNDDDHEEQ